MIFYVKWSDFKLLVSFFFLKKGMHKQNLSGALSDRGAISFQTPRQWMPNFSMFVQPRGHCKELGLDKAQL